MTATPLLALLLAGCMSMDGPCQVEVTATGGHRTHKQLQCEAGGSMVIVEPSQTIQSVHEPAPEDDGK